MFESALPLLLAMNLVVPAPAQQARDSAAMLRALLARAESQQAAGAEAQRQQAARQPGRPGRIQTQGNITVLVRESVPRDTIIRMAGTADSILSDFGGMTAEFMRGFVLVMASVTDTAALLSSPAMSNRERITLDWNGEADGLGERESRSIVEPLVRAFRETRDSTWQRWLDVSALVSWNRTQDGEAAINELTTPAFRTGNECLAGRLRSCRLWLGLDDDEQPYRARYKPEELVRMGNGRPMPGVDGAACRNGDADACARVFVVSWWNATGPVPAPPFARASLVRAFRELHGTEAVRRALADSTGSIGERLVRAAGVPEDSLMSEWRRWVLSRGRTERVTAGTGDVVTALLFSALLVGLAARSGRWR